MTMLMWQSTDTPRARLRVDSLLTHFETHSKSALIICNEGIGCGRYGERATAVEVCVWGVRGGREGGIH